MVIRLGLIGDNIKRSQSPRLHRLAGRLTGLDVTYDPLIPPDLGLDFDAVFDSCLAAGFRGINVTYPYKERVVARLAIDEPLVRSMGACNTVVFGTGTPKGFNTDCTGFVAAFRQSFPAAAPGVVAMAGAGGVGKAIAFALAELGALELRLFDPDRGKAQALARTLGEAAPGLRLVVAPGIEAAVRGADGLVNCTPIGMVGYPGTPIPGADDRCQLGLRCGLHAGRHAVPRGCRGGRPQGDVGLGALLPAGPRRVSHLHRPRGGCRSPAGGAAGARGGGRSGGMKTSIATVSISGDLPEKLHAIAAAGFDGVEIFEADFLAFDGSPAEVGRMVRDHGLEITVFQPFRNFEGMPEPERSRTFDRAERKFDLMGELGTELMLVCSSVSPLALGGIDRAAADFHELGERAARRQLRVGYEALAWGRHINDHRDAWEIVRRADHPQIGLILDSFHTLARRTDVATIRAIPATASSSCSSPTPR
ncbi:MAG: TIM barrel protein [Geminicoccaceae bacterium]